MFHCNSSAEHGERDSARSLTAWEQATPASTSSRPQPMQAATSSGTKSSMNASRMPPQQDESTASSRAVQEGGMLERLELSRESKVTFWESKMPVLPRPEELALAPTLRVVLPRARSISRVGSTPDALKRLGRRAEAHSLARSSRSGISATHSLALHVSSMYWRRWRRDSNRLPRTLDAESSPGSQRMATCL